MGNLQTCMFCGRDTRHRSRICVRCVGRNEHDREYASAVTMPWDEMDGECEYDYSEDALGPHSSDDRARLEWVDEECEWRKLQ